MADHLCARCGSKVIPLPQREARLGPGSELIGLVVGGAVYRVLMSIIIAALTALGFVYWVAWVVAALLLLALGYIAYTKWRHLIADSSVMNAASTCPVTWSGRHRSATTGHLHCSAESTES